MDEGLIASEDIIGRQTDIEGFYLFCYSEIQEEFRFVKVPLKSSITIEVKAAFDLPTGFVLPEQFGKSIASQLDSLVYKGFVSSTKLEHLMQMPRYLEAIIYRIDKLSRDVNRDLMYTRKIEEVNELYKNTLSRYKYQVVPDALIEVKWLIEELRVSYFAQQLGVKISVSDKRIANELKKILEDYPDHN